MIQALFFDCFGVLARKGTWEDFKASLPPDIDHLAVHHLQQQHDSGALSRRDFLYRMHELTGHEPALIEEVLQPNSLKNYGLLHYIAQLQGQYKIGIISNIASDWVRQEFLTLEEQELFEVMVFSYEVGVNKPDGKIFQAACSALNVPPEGGVLIDDSSVNVAGAKDFGMQAIEYESLEQLKQQLDSLIDH